MNIIYGFCFYYGYYKYNNIKTHIEKFSQLKTYYKNINFQLIINVMIDENNENERIKIIKDLEIKIMNDFQINIILLHNFNYGGTIAGLYDTYLYMKNNNLNDYYVSYFEEDFHYINISFLKESIDLLTISDKYIYIGENTEGHLKVVHRTENIQLLTNYMADIWTDGGYYFSKYMNLEKIENKIGRFHKGNHNLKYDHLVDGIILGEVGFPSELFHNGFEFIGLDRRKYFIHDD